MKRVRGAELERRTFATERDLDSSNRPVEPARRPRSARRQSRQRRRPDRRSRSARAPRAGQPAGEVELADVAAEEVVQVDRRDQQVDPLGASSRVASSSGATFSATTARAGERDRRPGPLLGQVGGGTASSRSRAAGRSRRGAASSRRQRERVGQHPLGAERLRPPEQSSRAAAPAAARHPAIGRPEEASSARRLCGAIRSPQRISRTVANCISRQTSTK